MQTYIMNARGQSRRRRHHHRCSHSLSLIHFVSVCIIMVWYVDMIQDYRFSFHCIRQSIQTCFRIFFLLLFNWLRKKGGKAEAHFFHLNFSRMRLLFAAFSMCNNTLSRPWCWSTLNHRVCFLPHSHINSTGSKFHTHTQAHTHPNIMAHMRKVLAALGINRKRKNPWTQTRTHTIHHHHDHHHRWNDRREKEKKYPRPVR